jgi:hypothetical protein
MLGQCGSLAERQFAGYDRGNPDGHAFPLWGIFVSKMPELMSMSFSDLSLRVLYYSPNQRLVGIAGKPNSVNALNVNQDSGCGKPNTKLAGICG